MRVYPWHLRLNRARRSFRGFGSGLDIVIEVLGAPLEEEQSFFKTVI